MFKLICRVISLAMSSVLVLNLMVIPQNACAAQITVRSGTEVVVKTVTTLIPDNLRVGDMVNLVVAKNVVINGATVIKEGAKVNAEVVSAKDNNYIGIAGKIGLSLKSVEAANGSTIMLSGSKHVEGKDKMVVSIGLSLICCILFALMKGGEASIEAGTEIPGYVLSDANLTL